MYRAHFRREDTQHLTALLYSEESMKLVLWRKDVLGRTSSSPVEPDEKGRYTPSPEDFTHDGYVCPGSEWQRVDHLVWVDVKNKNAEVAMILPKGISDKVASVALSAAWQEWHDDYEREADLRATLEEFEKRRAHLRGPVKLS